MADPIVPRKAPYAVAVEAGQEYWWCSCGRSRTQPFCDGSHQGSKFSPVQYTAAESKTVRFCGCKRSGSAPLCDGSHKSL